MMNHPVLVEIVEYIVNGPVLGDILCSYIFKVVGIPATFPYHTREILEPSSKYWYQDGRVWKELAE